MTEPAGQVPPVAVGREVELARVERFLDDLTERSLALVLEGEPGIGKTTLWSAGVAVARARRIAILACRPVESEARLAFSALADLLEAAPETAFSALPGPQRRALDAALLREGPDDLPPNPRAVAVATLGTLRALAQVGPVLIAVDDLPWLDRASAAALEFALRRLDTEPVGLLATARSGGALGGTQDRRMPLLSRADRLVLGPLSLSAFGAVLKARGPRPWRRPSLVLLHEACGGNPFFGIELADALAARGREPRPGEALPVPGSLHGLVRKRLATLAPPARDVVLLAAAASRPTVAVLIAASRTPTQARVGLDAAEAAGAIEIAGGEVRFVHPLLRSLVYADTTATQRRAVHRRLAEASRHPEERARHLALAAEGPDELVAAELDAAAVAAYQRGACEAAAELAELALGLTPETAAARGRRLVQAGEFHFAAFDPQQARQRLEEASACCEPGPDRADALWRLAKVIRYSGTAGAAADLLFRALGEPGSGPGLAASIHRDLGFVLANAGQAGGDEHYRAALELARQAGDRGLIAQMLGVVATAEFLAGKGIRQELTGPALRDATWTAHLPMELHPRVAVSHILQYSDDLEAARSLLLEEYGAAVERGAETDLPLVLLWLVEVERSAGRWELAGQYAEQGYTAALSSGATLPLACMHAVRAILCACRGEIGGARSDADAAIELGRRGGWYLPPLWGAHAHGLLQLSLGDAVGAHQALEPVTRMLLRPGGGRHAFVLRLVPDDIEALARLGALANAERLLGSFEAAARTPESGWARATAARCRALISSARGIQDAAVSALSEALAIHHGLGMPFELGRTLLVAGQVHRRARRKFEARAHLDAARDLFEPLGALLWAERTAEELGRLGLSRARPADLTAAEHRVAELAATGRTNREIAKELFMGQRTVEAHLTRIYRKLGTRRRTQLGPALQRLNKLERLSSAEPDHKAGACPKRARFTDSFRQRRLVQWPGGAFPEPLSRLAIPAERCLPRLATEQELACSSSGTAPRRLPCPSVTSRRSQPATSDLPSTIGEPMGDLFVSVYHGLQYVTYRAQNGNLHDYWHDGDGLQLRQINNAHGAGAAVPGEPIAVPQAAAAGPAAGRARTGCERGTSSFRPEGLRRTPPRPRRQQRHNRRRGPATPPHRNNPWKGLREDAPSLPHPAGRGPGRRGRRAGGHQAAHRPCQRPADRRLYRAAGAHGRVCIIRNHGTGILAPYGPVTFTTVITADGRQPPCGATSQWVNRIIRIITTRRGTLVLHEAGLQCPLPGAGPQVKAVWAADGADSTGIFADARGQGSDTADPGHNTAAPQGILTLSR